MHLLSANLHLCIFILHSLLLESEASKAVAIEPHVKEALQRRQLSSTTASIDPTPTSLPNLASSSATATSLSINLTHGVEDTWFSSGPITDNADHFPINIGCKNCSTGGNFTLTQGEWSVADFDIEDLPDFNNLTDIIDAGYVQLGIEDFVAHLEIQIEPDLKGDMTLPLFTIPGFGFAIPGLGSGGILVDPSLSISWELAGGIEMSYVFELQIPNLQVIIDFANPASSTVSGLDDISLKAVPFQANISDIELSLSLALAPRVSLGILILDSLIDAQVGVFLNLPKTTVTITQLATASVGAQCDESDGKGITQAYQSDFQHMFQNLTHIATEVEMDVGFDVQAKVSGVPRLDLSSSIELATLPVAALPTQCLVFQPSAVSAVGFTPAASALKAVQVSASAAASASSSAAAASITTQRSGGSGPDGKGSESSASGQRYDGLGPRVWFFAILSVMRLVIF